MRRRRDPASDARPSTISTNHATNGHVPGKPVNDVPPAELAFATVIGALSASFCGVGSVWSRWVTLEGLWIVRPAVPASTVATICSDAVLTDAARIPFDERFAAASEPMSQSPVPG